MLRARLAVERMNALAEQWHRSFPTDPEEGNLRGIAAGPSISLLPWGGEVGRLELPFGAVASSACSATRGTWTAEKTQVEGIKQVQAGTSQPDGDMLHDLQPPSPYQSPLFFSIPVITSLSSPSRPPATVKPITPSYLKISSIHHGIHA